MVSTMSIIGCILIAVIAQHWKGTLIAALIVGLLWSAVSGMLHWASGTVADIGFIGFYVATGTAAFVGETAVFFGLKLGIRALWARMRPA